MGSYVLRRVLSIIPTMLLVATMVFLLVRLAPGGPFDQDRAVPAEVKHAIEAKYHLTDPLLTQYKDWLGDLVFHADLGPTFKYPNRSVNEIIALSLPVSMELGILGMLLALVIGVPLGIIGAVRQNTWKDTLAMTTAMLGVSLPRFVLAPLLVLVFSLKLYWLPVARWESWRHMILPVICAAAPMAAYIARLTRGGMLEVVRSDFVRSARAKGLPEPYVVLRHGLANAMVPIVTVMGIMVGGLLGGAVITEQVFSIPGLGRLIIGAVLSRDFPVIQGGLLFLAVIYLVVNIGVDLLYAVIDPRVRLE